jgi:L-lysine exporter family protein LysE/ArgO
VWSLLSGFSLGLSLIVAIGGQNIWVLSQSMAGANRLVIALVCIICDAWLILLGLYSIAELQELLPALVPILTMAGVLMLLYLAFGAAKRAWAGEGALQVSEQVSKQSVGKIAATACAITLLNPHVYLDTVVLLGSLANADPAPALFATGACLASIVWFTSLTSLAPRLKVLLSSPTRWQIFDSLIAVILLAIALQMLWAFFGA